MWGETLGRSSSIISKAIDSIVLSLVVNRWYNVCVFDWKVGQDTADFIWEGATSHGCYERVRHLKMDSMLIWS